MRRKPLSRMMSEYCEIRLTEALAPESLDRLRLYLVGLCEAGEHPPLRNERIQWYDIARSCGIEFAVLKPVRKLIQPALEAIIRNIPKLPEPSRPYARDTFCLNNHVKAWGKRDNDGFVPAKREILPSVQKSVRRGATMRPIVEFPVALFEVFEHPEQFHIAFDLQMRRHGDTSTRLHRAVIRPGELIDVKTIRTWRRGTRSPRSLDSLAVLRRIEHRYRLPENYFSQKLLHKSRSVTGHRPPGISTSERRRIAWHLPDDFDRRPYLEKQQILEWVRRVIVSGATTYRSFQAQAMKQRYAIRFPDIDVFDSFDPEWASATKPCVELARFRASDGTGKRLQAPPELNDELRSLVSFKMSTLTTAGYQRVGVWNAETASQKIEHLGLLLGALAASPVGEVRGLGIPMQRLTLGLLVFPAIWDWYIRWRERRRGFYTAWEVDMLNLSLALTREGTGWLRQTPSLAERLEPVDGLLSQKEVDYVRKHWADACVRCHRHNATRVKELQRVVRVHRDPFEPILPILEADSPVREYLKIADEIIQRMPDGRHYPVAAAESVRSLLMLRFGLHLGLRQKNLRQLQLCAPGERPTPEQALADRRCGEMRWSERDGGWEVLIPTSAFKNANSSYFAKKPFRLILPDLCRLYEFIQAYIDIHRPVLLGRAPDPGTFFVKTVKITSKSAAYNQCTFYEAWRLTIQRFGIYNPYTGRGAIKGLLPHGPHSIRDVLATHILKKTGSYEQASYAIQDTAEVVAKHYGRFLPQHKAEIAARVLNLEY